MISDRALLDTCTENPRGSAEHAHTRADMQIETLPLYLRLSVVSLRISLESLSIYANGGTHPSTAPAHPKHEPSPVSEDDP